MSEPCAVVGCQAPGRPHRCPHDGQTHHHGRVHYGDYPVSALTFRANGWYLLCDEHYQFVKTERERWEREIRALRRMESATEKG